MAASSGLLNVQITFVFWGQTLPEDQEIRDLFVRLDAIEEPEEFPTAVAELQIVLPEHISNGYNRMVHVKAEEIGGPGQSVRQGMSDSSPASAGASWLFLEPYRISRKAGNRLPG